MKYKDLGFAKVDHHRAIRHGFPEVIFCDNKKPEQVLKIMKEIANKSGEVLATHATQEIAEVIKKEFPKVKYNDSARILVFQPKPRVKKGLIAVITAGTSDIPVAEESAITAETLGSRIERIYDVGVAGIHRLLAHSKIISKSNCIIAVAGMEGALPSVIGGIFNKPIIAVPTSIGYGVNFSGIAPLLTMLNSCASNVAVVNINNGFGAAYIAHLINNNCKTR